MVSLDNMLYTNIPASTKTNLIHMANKRCEKVIKMENSKAGKTSGNIETTI